MVIDLTQDSDPEDQPAPIQRQISQGIGRFLSKFTYRDASSLVPLKRKQESANLQAPIQRPPSGVSPPPASAVFLTNGNNQHYQNGVVARHMHPSTPSPAPEAVEAHLKAIEVAVPSPSRKLQTEIDTAHWTSGPDPEMLTGLSEAIFPVDAYERRARKGAYQVAKHVNRQDVPFSIGNPGSILTKRPTVNHQLKQALNRKLSKIKGPKVTFADGNERALALFAANFEFINSYKLGKGVMPADSDFATGCNCGSMCDPERCLCLDTEDNENSDDDSDDQTESKKIVPYKYYNPHPSRLLVLTETFLKRTAMILECGQRCECDKATCWNRVVQRGRTIRLEIFSTGNRGFGLRSPDPIYAGQFIDCYLGEVVTKDVADVREELASKQGHSYLFGLDFFPDVDEDDIYVVDGQKFGSPTRFMNHSCNPNCRMFPVSRTHHDQRLYDLAFFASRDIPPNVELTFDYNPGAKGAKSSIDPDAVRCLCGEENCRGQLWPNQRKGTK